VGLLLKNQLPVFAQMLESERQDGEEFRGSGIGAEVIVPDADHVSEQPQADEGVFLVLMLEKDVKKGRMAVDLRREKKVA
jgi:hypothetical protein